MNELRKTIEGYNDVFVSLTQAVDKYSAWTPNRIILEIPQVAKFVLDFRDVIHPFDMTVFIYDTFDDCYEESEFVIDYTEINLPVQYIGYEEDNILFNPFPEYFNQLYELLFPLIDGH